MSAYPKFSKKTCLETTRFYRKGKVYIYGLDCQGYISSLREQAGYSKVSPLSMMFQPRYTDKTTHKVYDWEQYYIWWKYDKGAKKKDNPMPCL